MFTNAAPADMEDIINQSYCEGALLVRIGDPDVALVARGVDSLYADNMAT